MSRKETQFTVNNKDGKSRTFTILTAITPDDLVRVSTKAAIHAKRDGTEYETPFSRDIRMALTRTHTAGST